MWILSLILSLCCALLTTSMQQSARVYLDYAQHRDAPRKQARIREYMFEGVQEFRLSQAVGTMPFLLHVSVFLFFAGLIEFLLPINTVLAFSALGLVGACALIYAALTLLPILHPNCPYRTPLSGFTYFSYHFAASSLFWAAKAIEGMFHEQLLKIWQRYHADNDGLIEWRRVLEEKIHAHHKWLLDGLQRRVVLSAMRAPSSVDARALYWTLTTLDEDKEFEEFASRMPGFFDSSANPGATSAMLSLMYERPTFDPILGSRLRELLGSCQPGASPLAEEQRNNRLRVCLTSLWYCLRAFNLPENLGEPLAPYVRAIFASPQVIGWIQTEEDLATRLLGRCFGSLVVRKLANDIASRTFIGVPPTTAEIACISYMLGTNVEQVQDWLDHRGDIDLANIIFLTSGEFKPLVASVAVTKGDVVDVFQQTLGILAEGMISSQANIEWDKGQVEQFQEVYLKLSNAPVPDVLKQRLRYILDRLPPSIPYTIEPKMDMPNPEPDSEITSSTGSSQNLNMPPMRIEVVPESGIGDSDDIGSGLPYTMGPMMDILNPEPDSEIISSTGLSQNLSMPPVRIEVVPESGVGDDIGSSRRRSSVTIDAP